MTTAYLYKVRYQRRGWKQAQQRIYIARRAANRLTKKLLLGDPDLAPVVYLEVFQFPLGDAEQVFTLDEWKGWDR